MLVEIRTKDKKVLYGVTSLIGNWKEDWSPGKRGWEYSTSIAGTNTSTARYFNILTLISILLFYRYPGLPLVFPWFCCTSTLKLSLLISLAWRCHPLTLSPSLRLLPRQ